MSVERELTNGTPPTLSLTIVDSGRDAMLIWLELGTRTIVPCVQRARRGGGKERLNAAEVWLQRLREALGQKDRNKLFQNPSAHDNKDLFLADSTCACPK